MLAEGHFRRLNSVRCALASQRVLGAANAEDTGRAASGLRIGINLGDVFTTDDGLISMAIA